MKQDDPVTYKTSLYCTVQSVLYCTVLESNIKNSTVQWSLLRYRIVKLTKMIKMIITKMIIIITIIIITIITIIIIITMTITMTLIILLINKQTGPKRTYLFQPY